MRKDLFPTALFVAAMLITTTAWAHGGGMGGGMGSSMGGGMGGMMDSFLGRQIQPGQWHGDRQDTDVQADKRHREQEAYERDMRRLDREIDDRSYRLKREIQKETPDDERIKALHREIASLEQQVDDLQKRHEQNLKER